MEHHEHFFYALELPGEIKDKLKEAASNINKVFPFNTWVHPQDFHITLAFLGNADAAKMDTSSTLIQNSIQKINSFSLEIDHLGIFGRKDAPRIFWAGLQDSANLSEVRQNVFSACLTAGFKLETRPFTPHITMARKWTGKSPFIYKRIEDLNPFKDEELIFNAKRVVLYKTHLGKSPKYEPITIFPLASRQYIDDL